MPCTGHDYVCLDGFSHPSRYYRTMAKDSTHKILSRPEPGDDYESPEMQSNDLRAEKLRLASVRCKPAQKDIEGETPAGCPNLPVNVCVRKCWGGTMCVRAFDVRVRVRGIFCRPATDAELDLVPSTHRNTRTHARTRTHATDSSRGKDVK